MASKAEHYHEAELLIADLLQSDPNLRTDTGGHLIALAQVHATLATVDAGVEYDAAHLERPGR